MNFTVIIALLQAAVSLLTASVGTPNQAQAILIANQAIAITQQALIQPVSPAPVQPQTTMTETTPATTPEVTAATPETVTAPATPKYTIEIISPMANKGLGRQYFASPTNRDESNYLVVAAIIRDDGGAALRDRVVTVTTSDPEQHAVLNGTGDIVTTYVNGDRQQVSGYVFQYNIRTIGDSMITFSADGIEKSVTINATEDKRN